MKKAWLALLASSLAFGACGQSETRTAEDPDGNIPSAASPTGGTAVQASIIYPGAQSTADGFSTTDPLEKVLDWYWGDQPMRQREGNLWTASQPEKRGDGQVVHLTIVSDSDGSKSYLVYLNPRASGGTAGRIRALTAEEVKAGFQI